MEDIVVDDDDNLPSSSPTVVYERTISGNVTMRRNITVFDRITEVLSGKSKTVTTIGAKNVVVVPEDTPCYQKNSLTLWAHAATRALNNYFRVPNPVLSESEKQTVLRMADTVLQVPSLDDSVVKLATSVYKYCGTESDLKYLEEVTAMQSTSPPRRGHCPGNGVEIRML